MGDAVMSFLLFREKEGKKGAQLLEEQMFLWRAEGSHWQGVGPIAHQTRSLWARARLFFGDPRRVQGLPAKWEVEGGGGGARLRYGSVQQRRACMNGMASKGAVQRYIVCTHMGALA